MHDLRLRRLIPLGGLTASVIAVACGTKTDNRNSDDPSGDGGQSQGQTGGQSQGQSGGQGGDLPEEPDPTGSGGLANSGGSNGQEGGAAGASSGLGGMGGETGGEPHSICDDVPPAPASVLWADEWIPTTVEAKLDNQREAFVQAVWVCRLLNEPGVWNDRCVPEHSDFHERYWDPALEDWEAYADSAEESSASVEYCAALSILAGACYARHAVLSAHCAGESDEVCVSMDSCASYICTDTDECWDIDPNTCRRHFRDYCYDYDY